MRWIFGNNWLLGALFVEIHESSYSAFYFLYLIKQQQSEEAMRREAREKKEDSVGVFLFIISLDYPAIPSL